MLFARPPRVLLLAPLLLAACQAEDSRPADQGTSAPTQARGIADEPAAPRGAHMRPPAAVAAQEDDATSASASSSSGAACVYAPDPSALCPAYAHPCTTPGSAADTACGYNPDNGLPGASYCSTACGTCPFCRMRGIQGQPCEGDVVDSCSTGLVCVNGTCQNLDLDGGICFNCPDAG